VTRFVLALPLKDRSLRRAKDFLHINPRLIGSVGAIHIKNRV